MNNNWNEANASSEIAGIHSTVVTALTAALVEWVWQGHEWVTAVPAHRFVPIWTDQLPGESSPGRWRLRGHTEFRDEVRAPMAEIRLWLRRPLDWDSLLAVAWVISHEFVCHAQRVPPRDGRPRVLNREDCPFFEGWMDEVAHRLFNARVASESPALPATGFVRAHAHQIAQAAASFRHDRYQIGSEANPQLLARQWSLGVQAARVLWRFFEANAGYDQEQRRSRAALAQLVGLSYRIQGATTSPEALRRVVNGCLLAGQSALSFLHGDQKARLLQLLTQPIPDSTVWIYEMESLCRTFPV